MPHPPISLVQCAAGCHPRSVKLVEERVALLPAMSGILWVRKPLEESQSVIRSRGHGDKQALTRVERLNTRIVGLGVILLVIALIVGLYTNQTILYSGQPGAESAVHESTTQPYLTEALVLAALGVAAVIAGLVMRRRPPREDDEREGSLGVDESEVRPPGPARPPPST